MKIQVSGSRKRHGQEEIHIDLTLKGRSTAMLRYDD